jgi:hypothetical protein
MTPIQSLGRSIFPCVILFFFFACAYTTAGAATFVVTNTNDSGAGSLRQAMLDANANSGLDTITFNIGSGLKTVAPTSRLPLITDPVIIDGTTQPGFAGSPLIEIDATNIPSLPNAAVLFVQSGNTTIRSLILNRFKDGGIWLEGGGGNHIEGCYIGLDATGDAGTNSQGNGITVWDAPNNVIGGTGPNTRNVIGALNSHAIGIGTASSGNQVLGNYIGTDATGTDGLAVLAGIFIGGSNNIVGGTTAAARNVIGTGSFGGVVIQQTIGPAISGNVVQGNYIGTDATGTIKLGFENYGVVVFNSSNNNVIGGTTPGAGNLVSGNGWGISIDGSSAGASGSPTGNIVQGNFVGVAADGLTPLPNRVQGVRLALAVNTSVGGTAAGAGNVIAFNGPTVEIGVGTGLEMLGGSGNSIRGNSIFSNGRLGIDLSPSGVTPNDPGDADTGANNLQNFPVITSAVSNAGQTTITGTLNSTPSTTFNIDFYSNATCDASGNGEGALPFGTGTVTTDANGNGSFNIIVPATLPVGRVITALAIDPSGNTSEFSACDASQTMGGVHFNPGSYTVIEDVGFVQLTVTRASGIGSVTVNYATLDGTAKAGQDYVATTGSITFAQGETTKTFNVQILDDAVFEQFDEAFRVVLTNPTNPDVVDSPGFAEITLKDNSVLPVLSVSSLSVAEGNTGTADAIFVVTLSAATGKTVTAEYNALPLTATFGVDFQQTTGLVTFNPREVSKTITVKVIGDTLDEVDEIFRLRLVNPQNALVGNTGFGTILDDDPSPTISISDVSVLEGNTGGTSMFFTVRLSTVSGRSVSVNYSTANGTAIAGTDYLTSTGVVTLNAGELEKSFSISLIADTQTESNETVFVNISSPTGATIVEGSATGTIIDDDGLSPPLEIMIDQSGPDPIQAAALDSMLFLRDPFPVVNSLNILNAGPDRNTRVIIFVKNLQGVPASSVVLSLMDPNDQPHLVAPEDVRALLDFTQVTFRLPDGLAAGKYLIEVKANAKSSNSASFRITN